MPLKSTGRMSTICELSFAAKSLISKVYEFDRKKHKLKPGEVLVVRGSGKPQLAMTQAEHANYLHQKQLGYFDQARPKRIINRTYDSKIDPKTNPVFNRMIRSEIGSGVWNPKEKDALHGSWPRMSHQEKDLARLTRFVRRIK